LRGREEVYQMIRRCEDVGGRIASHVWNWVLQPAKSCGIEETGIRIIRCKDRTLENIKDKLVLER